VAQRLGALPFGRVPQSFHCLIAVQYLGDLFLRELGRRSADMRIEAFRFCRGPLDEVFKLAIVSLTLSLYTMPLAGDAPACSV
jgi:hypothetical protein